MSPERIQSTDNVVKNLQNEIRDLKDKTLALTIENTYLSEELKVKKRQNENAHILEGKLLDLCCENENGKNTPKEKEEIRLEIRSLMAHYYPNNELKYGEKFINNLENPTSNSNSNERIDAVQNTDFVVQSDTQKHTNKKTSAITTGKRVPLSNQNTPEDISKYNNYGCISPGCNCSSSACRSTCQIGACILITPIVGIVVLLIVFMVIRSEM